MVWLAERRDLMVRRPVALKLPRVSWQGRAAAQRLAREREILASLSHPNIARLLDAGITGDGHPYLALEYVEGKPIDVHARDEGCRSAPGSSCFARSSPRSVTRTGASWCTATSSRPMSWSPRMDRCGCSTSGSPS